MPTRFRSYQPDQALLLPPSLRDWLPEGHIANHVSDLVDGLDLSVFYERYEGDGRRKSPYEPRMMVKLLLYGYATGVFSSRKIARKLEEDVAFRVLAADNFPSHRTICEFRRRHLGDFRKLFVEVVGLARETDAAEDARFGEALRGDELPEELRRREDRLAAIRAAKERLESRQREVDAARGREPGTKRNPKGGRPYKRDYGEPEETAQSNFTDPESGIMKTSSEGFQQCYNAQVAVSGENQLIVATEVSSNASDQGWILPLVEDVRTTFGEQPETVLADAGYCNEGDLAALEERAVDAYVALGREGKQEVGVNADQYPATARMGKKLATSAGRAQYAQRKWLSEAPNGWIKEILGFRRFSLRGLTKVQGEWDLVCLALNVRRMQRLLAG